MRRKAERQRSDRYLRAPASPAPEPERSFLRRGQGRARARPSPPPTAVPDPCDDAAARRAKWRGELRCVMVEMMLISCMRMSWLPWLPWLRICVCLSASHWQQCRSPCKH